MSEGNDRGGARDPLAGPRRSRVDRGEAHSRGFRQSRRAAEKARRRRLRRRRAVVLVVLVALAAAAFLGVSRIGGDDGAAVDSGPDDASTTSTAPVVADSVLVRVRVEADTMVALVLSPQTRPTLMVGLPGETLVRGSSGFERLNTFLDVTGKTEEAQEEAARGLEAMLGVKPAVFVSVQWSDVVEALTALGGQTSYPEELKSNDKSSADAVVQAFEALAEAADTGGDSAIKGLALDGDAAAVRTALRALSAGAGVAGGIPGRVVEGLGFAYFEPDPSALRAMLGGEAPESAVSVEVQNGSGLVGVAQKVAEAIAPVGYTLLPPKNADGFPDVETTQIYAAADVVGEADRLRTALGRGTVVQQDTLPPGRIVIVVGKDLDPDKLPGAGG